MTKKFPCNGQKKCQERRVARIKFQGHTPVEKTLFIEMISHFGCKENIVPEHSKIIGKEKDQSSDKDADQDGIVFFLAYKHKF